MTQYTIDDFREGRIIVQIDPLLEKDREKLRELILLARPDQNKDDLPFGTDNFYKMRGYGNFLWNSWRFLGTPSLPVVYINDINMENPKFKFGDLLDVTFDDAHIVANYTYVAPLPGDLHLISVLGEPNILKICRHVKTLHSVRTVPITAIKHSNQVALTKKEIEEKLCLEPGSLKIVI